jgi:hypothetical protein
MMASPGVGDRVQFVEGKSLAFYWGLLLKVAAVGLVTGVSLGGAVLIFGDRLPAWLAVPWLVLLGIEALALFAVLTAGSVARERELAAGYSTTNPGFMHVATVHPESGVVLRAAGEPLLTPEEYARRAALHVSPSSRSES